MLHQKVVCASKGLQHVLNPASISSQARANHEQGRAGARWTVEGDSGHVVLYGGVGGWWHGGTGGSWAPHGDIMVFVGELVVELEGCIDDSGSSSALEVLQRVIFKAFAARA